jgi:hypothetical protein
MGHVVFLTLYLGLLSGKQPVTMQVDGDVAAIRLLLDDQVMATLTSAPWEVTVDFGAGLEPRELVAVGLNAAGAEVARASQPINLPRPAAEAEITVNGMTAELRWRHIMNETPKRATLKLDDAPLSLNHYRAQLPAKLDLSRPHVLSAELIFPTGVARRERVVGGTLPATAGSELTATPVRQRGNLPATLDDCFVLGGNAVHVQAVEKPEALVLLVRDPDPQKAIQALVPTTLRRSELETTAHHRAASLAKDTRIRLIWPVSEQYTAANQPASVLFPYNGDFDSLGGGMLWHLATMPEIPHGSGQMSDRRQFADAVAVAGVQAMTGGRRRAVVLALTNTPDESRYQPATVRRYLARIGVPLFVWSLTGPRPNSPWGEVVDISNPERLRVATEALKQELETQRIAWLDADPIHALRAQAKPGCGLEPVATLR